MPAYVIVEVEVRDPQRYDAYKRMAEQSIAAHGGRYLARGGKTVTIEGDWNPKRLVVLEFPSLERAQAWWASPEYAEGKALRHATATSRMVMIEGL